LRQRIAYHDKSLLFGVAGRLQRRVDHLETKEGDFQLFARACLRHGHAFADKQKHHGPAQLQARISSKTRGARHMVR
jgi:hypothetical protein